MAGWSADQLGRGHPIHRGERMALEITVPGLARNAPHMVYRGAQVLGLAGKCQRYRVCVTIILADQVNEVMPGIRMLHAGAVSNVAPYQGMRGTRETLGMTAAREHARSAAVFGRNNIRSDGGSRTGPVDCETHCRSIGNDNVILRRYLSDLKWWRACPRAQRCRSRSDHEGDGSREGHDPELKPASCIHLPRHPFIKGTRTVEEIRPVAAFMIASVDDKAALLVPETRHADRRKFLRSNRFSQPTTPVWSAENLLSASDSSSPCGSRMREKTELCIHREFCSRTGGQDSTLYRRLV
jgi:hypothetical protein